MVLFLDEVDKLSGSTAWERFLRTEIFKLLDLGVPEGLCNADGYAISKSDINAAQDVLANKTLIIGGGAFQGIWETRSKTLIGFSDQAPPSLPVSLGDLISMLPRELTNRFRAEVLALPMLSRDDYLGMIDRTVAEVPIYLKEAFLRLANERIDAAVECQQGCRFLEEVILDSIICEREFIRNWKISNEDPAFENEQAASDIPDL